MIGSRLPVAAVVGAAMLWSTSFAVTKVVLPHVGELTLGAVRFLIAATLLCVVCVVFSQRLIAPMTTHLAIAGTGLIGITAYFALENYGVALATATDAVLIVASYPVITMGAEALFAKRKPTLVNLLGAAVAFGGVAIVVAGEAPSQGPHRTLGIVLLLLGGIAWTAYNMISERIASNPDITVGVLPTTFLQNFWGGIGFCVLIPVLPQGSTVALSPTSIWLILYLAVGCSAIAFLLYIYGLTTLSASQAVGILNLVPVFGVFWAFLIADEPLSLMKLLGAATVVLGVVLNTRSRPPELSPPPALLPSNLTSTDLRDGP